MKTVNLARAILIIGTIIALIAACFFLPSCGSSKHGCYATQGKVGY